MKSNLYDKNKLVDMTETYIKEGKDMLLDINLALQLNEDTVKKLEESLTNQKVPEILNISEKTDVFDFIYYSIKERKEFLENKIKTMEIIRGILTSYLNRKRFDKELFALFKLYGDYNLSAIVNL